MAPVVLPAVSPVAPAGPAAEPVRRNLLDERILQRKTQNELSFDVAETVVGRATGVAPRPPTWFADVGGATI